MKTYYFRQNTPQIFHNLIRFVYLPCSVLYHINQLSIYQNSALELSLFNLIDTFYFAFTIISACIGFFGFLRWKSYGWYSFIAYLTIILIYSAYLFTLSLLFLLHQAGTYFAQVLGQLIYSILLARYYLNRKPLFFVNPSGAVLKPYFCHKCGKTLFSMESNFCSNCGVAVKAEGFL